MPFTEAGTATVSVGEVMLMSDAELAQFMQKHRRPNGNYDLPVDGWEKLSKDERSRLAERLEAQKNSLAQSPTACSRPLDLDDLDARLRQVSPNRSFSLRPEPKSTDRSRSPTPPSDGIRHETLAYQELVNDGGHPVFPIELIQDVHRDPDNYSEMLRPWKEFLTSVSPSGIFQRQLQSWQDFRNWQNDNRGREDDDGGFPAFIEREKDWMKENFSPRSYMKFLVEIEADPSRLRRRWDVKQSLRERQRRLCRERGCREFRDYAQAVKRRLARHDFTQPFELDEDPKKQNRLTTWIEYLSYEYWWLDKHTSNIERLEPEHDKLWQELVDEKILRPHETKEFVRTMASPMERAKDRERAEKAVERAESEGKRIIHVLTQKDPKRLHIPRVRRISMLKQGTEELVAAKRRLAQIASRNDRITEFIRGTFGYAGAKRDAAHRRVIVQWVLDQVPLIEAEMNPSKANGPETAERRTTKRKRTTGEEPPERQSPKRVRVNLEPRLANARASSKATDAGRSRYGDGSGTGSRSTT